MKGQGPRYRQPAVDTLVFQCKVAKLPVPQTEFQFHATRKWKADVCWPYITNPLIVEVDGGLYVNGGHTRGAAREKDYERDAEALKLGYRILRVSPGQVKSGKAILWLQDLLYGEKQAENRPLDTNTCI